MYQFQISTELFDIDENAFEPYPQSFSSAAQTLVLQDPFNGPGLSTIAESVPQHFQSAYSEMFNVSSATSPHTTCSVCGCTGDRIAVLVPCKHLLCSACMTSALNIVGEKDIHCAVCKMFVNDFELQTASDDDTSASTVSQRRFPMVPDVTFSPLQQRSARGEPALLPNTFDPNSLPSLMSTMSLCNPQMRHSSTFAIAPQAQRAENVVLRIDNVPWVRSLEACLLPRFDNLALGYYPSCCRCVVEASYCSCSHTFGPSREDLQSCLR